MSVVEFSADSWQASSPDLQKGLGNRIEALSALAQGLESLAASGNISGRGADAMRAYIREVHVPIVQSLLVSLQTFQTAIGVYWHGYGQVDTDGNFRLVNDEFDQHLTRLNIGKKELQAFASTLRAIDSSASHLVSLGGAGANAAESTADEFGHMHLIAKTQQETWKAYEATDPGFAQVKALLAELKSVVNNVGHLTVGQGRSYTAGSFNLTLQQLSDLTGGMMEYCQKNQQIASDGWKDLFAGYVDDVKAKAEQQRKEAERKRKEDALWGLLWDGLQVVAGAVITAIGVGVAPFTAGFSLGLTVLGGSLVVGGVNSAINHVSIASTGQELNLIGSASKQVGQWYDANVAQPAIKSGNKTLQFLAGVGSGLGQMVSAGAQMNVKEIGEGLYTLATDEGARSQLWKQLSTVAGKAASGDAFVIGQIAANVIPLGAAAKVARGARIASMADHAVSALSRARTAVRAAQVVVASTADTVKHVLAVTRDDFLNALGNAEKKLGEVGQNLHPAPALAGVGALPPGTPVTDALTRLFRTTDRPTTARTGLANGGSNGPTGATEYPSTAMHAPDQVQVIADKIRRGEMTPEEIKALPTSIREQLGGIDRGDKRDIFGHYTGSDTVSANKEALGLQEVGLDLGVDVMPDQIVVRFETGGQGRRYDGLIHVEGNQYIGVEVKSGNAYARYNQPGNAQWQFDNRVSQDNPARGLLNGQPIEIIQVIDHTVP